MKPSNEAIKHWSCSLISLCGLVMSGPALALSSSSDSTASGPQFAVYNNVTQFTGAPGGTTLATGNLGTCTVFVTPPPTNGYGVCPVVGSGTAADPFLPPCLSNCTLPGTPLLIAAGQVDSNDHTYGVPIYCTASTCATKSTSTSVGPTNANFTWTNMDVGPQTVAFGSLGECTIPPPPYPNCTPFGGSGTAADPFIFSCSTALALSNCTLPGTTVTVPPGAVDFDTHIHAQRTQPAVVSRKVHGTAGTFDLPLSTVATNPTTEPRQGPTHTIVFTFDSPITAATPALTEGIAVVGTPIFNGNDVVVGLTGVADQQYVTISLTNVTTAGGGSGGSASVRLGFLRGDVNGNRVVTVADLGLVNAQLAQFVTQANFLKDVNVSGTLSVADKAITNANLTRNLPAP